MKKQFILGIAISAVMFASCSGHKADGKDSKGQDTGYQYSDTSRTDSAAQDTVRTDAYQDSTSNAPRLPGGK